MENCLKVTKRFLDSLKIRYTEKYLRDCILTHQDYPSLLSISDTLNKYHIENLAIKTDISKLKDFPKPCLVQVNINNDPFFFVLKSVLEHTIIYYNEKNKLVSSTKEEFLKQWTGICLLVETSEKSKEVEIEKKVKGIRFLKLLKTSVIVLLLSWVIISFLKSNVIQDYLFSVYTIIFTFLKIIGLAVGISLLWYDVDKYNPKLQNFCSGNGGVEK